MPLATSNGSHDYQILPNLVYYVTCERNQIWNSHCEELHCAKYIKNPIHHEIQNCKIILQNAEK